MEVRTLAVEVLEGPDSGLKQLAETELLTVGTAPGNVLVLSDETVSRYHLELDCSESSVVVRDLGSTNGTKAGSVGLVHGRVPLGTVLNLGHSSIKLLDGAASFVALHHATSLHDLVGQTNAMRRLMAQLERVGAAKTTVLISGESGTGKEVVARAIHDLCPGCPERAFVTVDCASLTPTLAASELFGHEKGAFTSADRQHIGAFERANNGTVFLDEIGELPAELQRQLLGVLERGRFHRVGGKDEIHVDVRVVCATNRDLRSEVNAGTFRMDLYYRIAVVELRLPPLRERSDDIALLIEHFLKLAGHDGDMASVVPDAVLEQLMTHHWPGNVRELRNWVEATLAMGEAPELRRDALGASPPVEVDEGLLELPYKEARGTVLQQFESRYLARLIDSTDGNVTQAAKRARMDRSYLIKLLQRHDIR
jgi:DNA-binding NtrC family response regulator